jgi:hypothetical protein
VVTGGTTGRCGGELGGSGAVIAGRCGGELGGSGAEIAGRSGGTFGAPGLAGGDSGWGPTARSERGACASGLVLPGSASGKGRTGMTRGAGGVPGEPAATRTPSGPSCGAVRWPSVRSDDCGAEPPRAGRAASVEPPARASGSITRPATLVPSSPSSRPPPTTMPATTLNDEDGARVADEESPCGEGVPSTIGGEPGSISVWTATLGASAVSGWRSRRATRPAVTVDATTSTLSAAVATTMPAPPLYRLNPTTLRLAGSEPHDLLPG